MIFGLPVLGAAGSADAAIAPRKSRRFMSDSLYAPGILGAMWRDDSELFAMAGAKLFSAVIGDVMDSLGLLNQFLPPQIQPLRNDMVVFGRSMPVLERDTDQPPTRPFGLMLEALDDLKRNEVYVASGSATPYALWGELMSTRAMKLGGAGAVLDGYSRDTHGILRLGFPTFSLGRYAQDQGPRGEVIDFRVSIRIGGVEIAPGDIVFGDIDGVLVIPRAAEEEVLRRAIEKVEKENLVRVAIEEGMPCATAFAMYGVM
jgi:regulator of RNase E activity RraA